MEAKIAVLPGDGIGPEVITESLKVLNKVAEVYGHKFILEEALIGGAAIDATGKALPDKTFKLCQESDAVLLGAVGGPKWADPQAPIRPEQGLLGLRSGLGLFANLRPVKLYSSLLKASTIKEEVIEGVDLVVVRELTGGIYFGKPSRRWTTPLGGEQAVDTCRYKAIEIERILRVAFDLARQRRKHLTSVDKANILSTSRLWRSIADELSAEYPDVTLEHMLVDACAMRLIRRPKYFDVIVTENMFGDILTDEASMLAGSMGMLPSASLSETGRGMYEPIHGSAPYMTGQNIANPLATILSCAMMLRYSFELPLEADAIEAAVEEVLNKGYRTKDIMEEGKKQIGTREMGDLVSKAIE